MEQPGRQEHRRASRRGEPTPGIRTLGNRPRDRAKGNKAGPVDLGREKNEEISLCTGEKQEPKGSASSSSSDEAAQEGRLYRSVQEHHGG